MEDKRIVCWFSCGAASAVATKLAIKEAGTKNLVVVYQETGSEHPDNERFLTDCEKWFGLKIMKIKSKKYTNIWDVFEKTKYLVGVGGARCTSELKRKVAEDFINFFEDREVMGYTVEEKNRVERFIANNEERDIWPILVEKGLTKTDCLGIINRAGIEIPAMYKLGYNNNNCIGCVKGQQGYWNKIRKDFPEVFERMSKVERKMNVSINKKYINGVRTRVFLDELDPNAGRDVIEEPIQCGFVCMETEEYLTQTTKS